MVAASFLAKACSSSSTGKESAKLLPPCKVTTAFWTLLLRVRRWYGLTAGAAAGRAAGAAAGRAAGAAAGGTAGADLKRIVASSCCTVAILIELAKPGAPGQVAAAARKRRNDIINGIAI